MIAPPFVAVPWPDAKDAKWAKPRLVCDIEFTQWTGDGRANPRSRGSGRTGSQGAEPRVPRR
jgi:hypothetical protein